MQAPVFLSALLLTSLLAVASAAAERPSGMAQATFAVHCYGVGAGALAGKSGIISVERGWSGTQEVDRVIYNPQQVTLDQLESRLQVADTYISTLKSTMGTMSGKEMSR